ncbi:MAG TPA: hypothetical protein VET46_00275 [Steroidobacteraceae bacterium]|nr:hypothetical protein [Steroidobacteraceae bacterium]
MHARAEVGLHHGSTSLRRGLALLVLILAAPAGAQEAVPPALHGWEAWTLHGHENHRCPWLAPGGADDDARICAWPASLELQVDGRGGRFSQRWQVEAEGWLPLPGGMEQWPLEVTLDGKAAAVVAHGRLPALRVPAGTHTVAGNFTWARRPALLPLPAEIGLVALTIDGARIAIPQRNATGVVLGAQPMARQDNRLAVRVFRLLSDELPGTLTTQVHLAVAGEAREVRLPNSLPGGFIPTALAGDLPARLDADNTLRVQVRPGEYDITLTARGPSPVAEVHLGKRPAPWPAEEVWSFRGNDRLRVVAVEGVPPTDPRQANVPSGWRGLPAYRMNEDAVLKLLERSRGMSAQDANQLQLERTAWLDFSGASFMVVDRIAGTMRQGWRLEMSPPFALESVRTPSDESLLVTSGMARGATGVELRQPQVDLTTVARLPRVGGRLPATGWSQRFTLATGQLVMGPGYRLLAALGPDSAPQAWLERWRLLDIFAVLLIATAAGRLLGLRVATLAVAAVVLTYQDLGAPAWLWLNVLVALALVRVVPQGRLGRLLAAYRVLAVALLLIALVPFLIGQARLAVYPQLETYLSGGPGASLRSYDRAAVVMNAPVAGRLAAPPIQTQIVEEVKKEVLTSAPAASPSAISVSPAAVSPREVMVTARRNSSAGYEPGVLVQAGPGMPQWRYHVYDYSWSGPLEPNATARFVISPPWLTRLWRIVGIVLSVLLIVELTRGEITRLPDWLRRRQLSPAAALFLTAVAALGVAPQARADSTPAPALLKELQARLLAAPKCAPDCADVIEAHVSVDASRLQVVLTVAALDAVGIALPGAEPNWAPDTVQVDGGTVGWVYRSADGVRYVSVAPGRHVVRVAGSLQGLEGLALAFPLAPHVVDVSAVGWDVSGVNARRLVSGGVGLVRRRAAQESGNTARQEEFPPFVRVTRIFRLAHDWTIDTVVERVAPPSGAFTVRLPLLPQESVTSAGLEARDNRVTVGLAANDQQTEFNSIIPIGNSIELVALEGGPYSERWVFAVGSTWHVDIGGIPPVAPGHDADGTYEYYPRPGEHLAVRITRPEPVAGGTLAYDGAELMLNAGKRSSDLSLVLAYRSTQGGREVVHLPDDAEVTLVRSDNDTLGLRPEKGELSLPALPGRHTWTVNWRSATGAAVVTRAPAVSLASPAGNLHIGMRIPEDRWVLYAYGPGIGPAILYWGELIVFIAIAWLIGRSRLTPLPARDWLLLGLGLSTLSWSVFGLFVLFVALFQWRAASGAAADWRRFNLLQVGLAVLAVAAVLCVVAAVPGGLLARPDMRISGGGDYGALEWFVDQTRDGLPRPGVLSVSLWWYKIAMLAWALWLSFVLTRWLKWAWEVFARDGLWRSQPAAPPPPPRSPEAS